MAEPKKEEAKALAPAKAGDTVAFSPIVKPAVTAQEAKEAWKSYQELKKAILDESEDIQIIQSRKFLKKSYWKKLATFFNLSIEVVEERVVETPTKNVIFHFICKAIAPNGRYAIGAGSSDLLEKGYRNTFHNTRATAETRASNRAVSNLVGGGEVSAEEIDLDRAEKDPAKEETADVDSNGSLATVAQRKAIFAIGNQRGMDSEAWKEMVKGKFGLESFADLTKDQASQLIGELQAGKI